MNIELMLSLGISPVTAAGCCRWGIQSYFAWMKNPKPKKEKKKEKLLSPNGYAPAVIGRLLEQRNERS